MKKILLLSILFFSATIAQAQFIKEKSISVQAGYGISAPEISVDRVASGGFFAQGELVLKVTSWLDFRPYIGFVITNSDGNNLNGNPSDEMAETKAALLGGKARLRAPIPYIAPYIEIGMGTSIGKFETLTAFDEVDKSGIIHHIPFSLGLELGKNHSVDLGLTYYFQSPVEQYIGAIAVGVRFPLN